MLGVAFDPAARNEDLAKFNAREAKRAVPEKRERDEYPSAEGQ